MYTRTEIAEIGGFGLIQIIKKLFPIQNKEVHIGIGDDASIIENSIGFETVVTTELFVEGVHFDLSYFPLRHLGYKITVAAISDIPATVIL